MFLFLIKQECLFIMYDISTQLESMKNDLTNMYVAFNNLNSDNAKANRSSDNLVMVKGQFNADKIFINSLRNNALEIFDLCNRLLMINET